MKEIRTEIFINATKEEVWKVLTNFEKYSDWNPFIVMLEGKPVKGTKVKAWLKLNGNKPMVIKPVVLNVEENEKFEWFGKTPLGFFNGQHYFLIETITDKKVKFVQGEYFTGWLVKFVLSKIEKKTQQGFIEMNKALKTSVEQM